MQMRGVGREVEARGVDNLEEVFHLVLALDELVEVIVQSGAEAILLADVAEVVVELAGHADVLGDEDLRDTAGRKDHQLGGAKFLQEAESLAGALLDLLELRTVVGGAAERD